MSDNTTTITEEVDGVAHKVTLQKSGDGTYREVGRTPIVPRRKREERRRDLPVRVRRRPLNWTKRKLASFGMWLFGLTVNRPLGWVKRKWAASWIWRTWVATDPAKDVVPAVVDLPTNDRLKADGLDDARIAKLRANPRAFPHTLRRFGFYFGGVRGEGFAERMVGVMHYLWARSPMSR